MATSKTLTASTSKTVSTGFSAGVGLPVRNSRRLVGLFTAAVLLSGTALAISSYLSYVAFTSTKILGCGGGVFNCDHVLTSRWSTLLGLPVAAWASSMYLGVLTALLFTSRSAVSAQPSLMRQWSWCIVTAAAVSAGLAALWFIGLQAFVLEHYCPWCLGAHSCGILLSILTLSLSPLASRVKGMCASLGFTATLGLVVIQLMTPAPQTYEVKDFPEAPLDGGVIEEPATFDAPGSDGDVFMAPDAQSSVQTKVFWIADANVSRSNMTRWSSAQWTNALKSFVNPTLLLTAQAGDDQASAKPADSTQPATQTQPAAEAQPAEPAKPAESGEPAGQAQPTPAQPTPAQPTPAQPTPAQPTPAQPTPAQSTPAAQPAAPQAPAAASRTVHLSSANIKLRPEQWPMLGSPDAKHIFVEMFDYTCKHCRNTQRAIKGARAQLGPDLGIILLPVPLNRNCNPHAAGNPNANACELAELALCVWKADTSPNKANFEAFHEWLLEGPNAPSLGDATNRAAGMVGGAQALNGAKATAQKFLKSNVDIYQKMTAGAVPKLIFPTTVMTGELQAPNVLVTTIQRQPVSAPANVQTK